MRPLPPGRSGRRFDLGKALDQLALVLVSELALGEAAEELIVAASKTLEGLRRAARPMGLAPQGAGTRQTDPVFDCCESVAEPYLAAKLDAGERVNHVRKSCVFARMAAARSSRGTQLDGDEVRDEMMTVLVAMMAGFSCGLKHAFYWIFSTPGTQAGLSNSAGGSTDSATAQEIRRRPFLDAVCKEVLRYCPDIPFAVRKTFDRKSTSAVETASSDDVLASEST